MQSGGRNCSPILGSHRMQAGWRIVPPWNRHCPKPCRRAPRRTGSKSSTAPASPAVRSTTWRRSTPTPRSLPETWSSRSIILPPVRSATSAFRSSSPRRLEPCAVHLLDLGSIPKMCFSSSSTRRTKSKHSSIEESSKPSPAPDAGPSHRRSERGRKPLPRANIRRRRQPMRRRPPRSLSRARRPNAHPRQGCHRIRSVSLPHCPPRWRQSPAIHPQPHLEETVHRHRGRGRHCDRTG